ncbi:PREDICTED: 5-hydroxytryptamine receptor 3A-like [Nanorana parkeri]|uniref:5-hydroxytryptamine receptor 3A-like n=1 Tax=Nanorana parkeri TaxID=125878 RepID=UPI0008548FC7|nr:PREDICTED: 5-hydroxytryptamine receptor 3A-like [Nanorana parkeri]
MNGRLDAFACLFKAMGVQDVTKQFLVRQAMRGFRKGRVAPDSRRPVSFELLVELMGVLEGVCVSRYEAVLFRVAFVLAFFWGVAGISQGGFPCSFHDLVQNLYFPNSSVRPVKNWLTVTNVTVDITLYSVVQMDTGLQSLTTLIWVNIAWYNEYITWDPVMNCSIKYIMITGDSLWKPDLYVYEMIENDNSASVISYFNITYKGKIINAKPMRIVSTCNLNIYRFPFDTQFCNLSFGPYIHSVKDIVMFPRSDSSTVLGNTNKVLVSKGDWLLLNITVNSSIVISEGTNYSQVYYTITLKRVPVVYIITLILPAIFMVLLDIVSMFIQMESSERLTFKITIVLGFSVLLLILNNMLPTSDTLPVLGIFCLVCMAVMVFSLIGCVTISYTLMLSKSQSNVPSWVKTWILTYLATLLCFKSFSKYGININQPESDSETYSNNRVIKTNSERRNKKQRSNEESLEVKLLKKLLKEILKIHAEFVESRNKQEFKSEWHAVALVIDRFVLISYLIIVTVLFATVIIIWAS